MENVTDIMPRNVTQHQTGNSQQGVNMSKVDQATYIKHF